MSSGFQSRSPAGSAAPSPTEGLFRRLSWNSAQGEAISMRDLAGSVFVDPGGPRDGGYDEHDIGVRQGYPPRSPVHPYSAQNSAVEAGTSFQTPVRPFESRTHYEGSTHSDDDLARLTPNAPDRNSPASSSRRVYDSEGRARASPLGIMARSPTLRRVSHSLRVAGERVVNIMGTEKDATHGGYSNLDRLSSTDEDSPISPASGQMPFQDSTTSLPPITHFSPPPRRLRGRTLGIFGKSNPLRKAMDRFLRFSWTEPVILLLILLNVIVLTIQSTPALFTPRTATTYFNEWEDYVLFVLFIVFT